jgi:hypothetical protein
MANLQRPNLPHTFSQQLSLHRRSRDERRPLLASSTFPRGSGDSLSARRSNTEPAASEAYNAPGSNPIPSITFNASNDDYDDDEEEHADSDGLYPPHCCFTTSESRSESARARADPFGTNLCKVYLNIHRYVSFNFSWSAKDSMYEMFTRSVNVGWITIYVSTKAGPIA